jgi:hypothetical protein
MPVASGDSGGVVLEAAFEEVVPALKEVVDEVFVVIECAGNNGPGADHHELLRGRGWGAVVEAPE